MGFFLVLSRVVDCSDTQATASRAMLLVWPLVWSVVLAQIVDVVDGQPVSTGSCTKRHSFTPITFGTSRLVRSNLGGLGSQGKCEEAGVEGGLCEELETAATPREIYIENIGRTPEGANFGVRITNSSECIPCTGHRTLLRCSPHETRTRVPPLTPPALGLRPPRLNRP